MNIKRKKPITGLSKDQEKQAISLLVKNVPIPKIVDALELDDADLLYDALYKHKIKNNTYIVWEKWIKSISSTNRADTYVEKTINAIYVLREKKGALTILDHGCGTGKTAYKIAKTFPDCQVEGIDLSTSGIKKAQRELILPNLKFSKADGYDLREDYSSHFDVVYHNHVLEHVPQKIDYLEVGLDLLKDDGGLLLITFPSEKYWRFWGFVKYITCKLLQKPFLTHAFLDTSVDNWIDGKKSLHLNYKSFEELNLPRRVYYYFPDWVLAPLGKYLYYLEKRIKSDNIFISPMMLVYFEIYYKIKPDSDHLKQHNDFIRNSKCNIFSRLSLYFQLLLLWFLSSFFLIIEVVIGRKIFFKQH